MAQERKVAFATSTAGNAPDPLAQPAEGAQQQDRRGGFERAWLPDHLKQQKDFLLRLEEGDNLIRFVPAFPGEYQHFILPTQFVKLEGTELVISVGQAAVDQANRVARDNSPVAEAFWWFYKNAKEQLHDPKENPRGFKLKPKRVGVAWVVSYDAEKKPHLRLFNASIYAGDKGTKGVLGDVLLKSKEMDTDPETQEKTPKFGDISHPTEGNFVNITKTVDPKAKSAEDKMKGTSYAVSISTKKSRPIQDILDEIPDAEFNRLEPLEKVVQVASEAKQHAALRSYLGKWYEQIFVPVGKDKDPE